jgi:hypothetical protein
MQWLVFGVMGAAADLSLMTATIVWYRHIVATSATANATHAKRWHHALLRAISSHFIYVILYFINCLVFPPLGKVTGLMLNALAATFTLDFFVLLRNDVHTKRF